MIELIQSNLVLILVALAIGVVVGWWIYRRSATQRVAFKQTETLATPRTAIDAPLAEPPVTPAAAPPAPPASVTEPSPPAAEQPMPAASNLADDLQTLKGVGPKLAARLNELGITRFDQLAALSAAQADALDTQLGQFNGRLKRDRVVEQAGFLARGELEAYQAMFGNLGS